MIDKNSKIQIEKRGKGRDLFGKGDRKSEQSLNGKLNQAIKRIQKRNARKLARECDKYLS